MYPCNLQLLFGHKIYKPEPTWEQYNAVLKASLALINIMRVK